MSIFKLVDPPPGQAEVVGAAIAAIDFDWTLLTKALSRDEDGCVLVKWGDTGQNVSGLFYGHSYEIHLTDDPGSRDMAFVFAHEVGHLIDRAFLTDEGRAALMRLFHAGPYRQLGHFNHDHPDAGHNHEEWLNGEDPYVSRIYEAFADQFVAAFAPTVWEGRYPRFVHWSDDHDTVRELTLACAPEPVRVQQVDKERRRPRRRDGRRLWWRDLSTGSRTSLRLWLARFRRRWRF